MKRAFITGITGQDGSYLADLLLEKGYEVHGLVRRCSGDNLGRIRHVFDRLHLHPGDVTAPLSLAAVVQQVDPDEVYHEADQDHVGHSLAVPELSASVTYGGTANLLEAVRKHAPAARVFVPVSATMFGDAPPCQNENTPLNPLSPYACAKAGAYHLAGYYRQAHNLFVACGILFNHDSPRRGPDYLLQRICRGVAEIAHGRQQALTLNNLDQRVDIGHAQEYMDAACKMLQMKQPADFVLASNRSPRIRELVEAAFSRAGIKGWRNYVVSDPAFDAARVPTLLGDTEKARRVLGFVPEYTPDRLAVELTDHHLRAS